MTTGCIQNVISANWQNIQNSPKTPRKVDWKTFNPNKELHPIGKSGKVCLNLKPIRINRKWEKEKPEGCDVVYVCGYPLFRMSGMIYWYSIGDVEFDIREMRRLANAYKLARFEEDYAADHDHKNPLEGLTLVANQLDKILQRVESHFDFFGSPPPLLVKFEGTAGCRLRCICTPSDDLPF